MRNISNEQTKSSTTKYGRYTLCLSQFGPCRLSICITKPAMFPEPLEHQGSGVKKPLDKGGDADLIDRELDGCYHDFYETRGSNDLLPKRISQNNRCD